MKSQKFNESRFKCFKAGSIFFLIAAMLFIGCSGGGGGSSDDNKAPSANAGADQTVIEGDTVTLDGSGSSDSDGTIASYSWSQSGGSIDVVLSGSDTANATFAAPAVDSNTPLTFTLTVNDNSGASSSDTVIITVSDSNNSPPSADAGSDQSVDEGSTVTLDGSGSSDSDGTVESYLWSQSGGPVNAILADATSASLTFVAPYVTSSTDLTFTLEVTDDRGAKGTDTVTVTVANVGSIVGNISPFQGQVDLGAEGDLDWSHWGLTDVDSFNQKGNGGGAIGTYAEIQNDGIAATRFENSPIAFSWSSGGSPTASAKDTKTGLYFGIPGTAIGEGVRLTIDAGTAEKTLRLYLGTTSAEAKITATLSDNTAAPYEVTMNNASGSFIGNVVTLTFGAESESQTLTVDFTLLNDTGLVPTGALDLLAASLTNGKVNPPTITQSAATSDSIQVSIDADRTDATLRYTTDGSDPDENSTLYTGPFDLPGSATVKAVGFSAGLTASDVAETEFVVSATTGGNLTAFVADAPLTVDLETEGGLDWSHWGLSDAGDWNHKDTVDSAIGDYTPIGTVNVSRFDNCQNAVSLSKGGTPTEKTADTATGLQFGIPALEVDEGVRLTVDADTSEKELKLYIGTTSVEAKLTATFSGDLAPAFETTLSNVINSAKMRVVTIDYSAASDDQALTIDYTLLSDPEGDGGAINLQAATLD